MFGGLRPDVTPAQLIAVVGSIIGVAVAFGLDISDRQQDAILNLVAIVSGSLIGGDAVLRGARNVAMRPPGERRANPPPPPLR